MTSSLYCNVTTSKINVRPLAADIGVGHWNCLPLKTLNCLDIENCQIREVDDNGICIPEELRYFSYFHVYDFEELQVPTGDEELYGGKLHFKHVSAAVSLCSNMPGRREHVSDCDPQKITDKMIETFLTHSTSYYRTKFKSYTDILEEWIQINGLELGIGEGEEEHEIEEEQDVQIGKKRKHGGSVGRGKRRYVADEADFDDSTDDEDDDDDDDDESDDEDDENDDADDDDDDDDESDDDEDDDDDESDDDEDDGDDESDVEGLIGDDEVEDNDSSFSHALDNQGTPTTPSTTPTIPLSEIIEKDREDENI